MQVENGPSHGQVENQPEQSSSNSWRIRNVPIAVPIIVGLGLTEKVVARELGFDLHVTPAGFLDIQYVAVNTTNLLIAFPGADRIMKHFKKHQ